MHGKLAPLANTPPTMPAYVFISDEGWSVVLFPLTPTQVQRMHSKIVCNHDHNCAEVICEAL